MFNNLLVNVLLEGYINNTVKSPKKREQAFYINKQQFNLTEEDRITYIYKTNVNETIIEVTCVSYDILINHNWVTIIYYDDSHDGILHRHTLIDYKSSYDIIDTANIKKDLKNSHKKLTWSLSNIRKNYRQYRRSFIKKNKVYFKEHGIEIY